MKLLDQLQNFQVIVSTGTGGVGKTTVSAALGVALSRRGKKVLVLTIDPAYRLAQALGLGKILGETVKVDVDGPGELYASMIDAKSIFDRFVERFSPTPAVAQKLKSNRLYRQLVTALTGSQEFTSMERLIQEHESGVYDVVILDTPPSQNAIDFFRAPERMLALFDQAITKWFIRDEKPGLIKKILSKGTLVALNALERITGKEFVGELSDFFEQMSLLQGKVSERSLRVKHLMQQSHTGFILVTSGDPQKQREAHHFLALLAGQGLKIQCTLVNRAYPKWLGQSERWAAPQTALEKFYAEAQSFYEGQRNSLEDFKNLMRPVAVAEVPESYKSLNGLKDVVSLSEELEAL